MVNNMILTHGLHTLPLSIKDAQAHSEAFEVAHAPTIEQCMEQIKPNEHVKVIWLAHDLQLTQKTDGTLLPHLIKMASHAEGEMQLRFGLALMWLNNDYGLEIVLAALRGNNYLLRAKALQEIMLFSSELKWPERYYSALFVHCQSLLDSAPYNERQFAIEFCFNNSIPSFVNAMRHYVTIDNGWKQHHAAMWLMAQGLDEGACQYINQLVATEFPAIRLKRDQWYHTITNLLSYISMFHERTTSHDLRNWSLKTVLTLVTRLVDAAEKPGEPNVEEYWYGITGAISVVSDKISNEVVPILKRWALSHKRDGLYRGSALSLYARFAGESSIDDLIQNLNDAEPWHLSDIARWLLIVAPESRYSELAKLLREVFDSIGPQSLGQYGESTDEQYALSSVASALAIFDPTSVPHIYSRLTDYGPILAREVQWALEGLTPFKVAALLFSAGATEAMNNQTLFKILYENSSGWVRGLFDFHDRLAAFGSRDDCIDSPAIQTLKALALVARPQIVIEHVSELNSNEVIFAYQDSVFQAVVSDYDSHFEMAGYFNVFLERIGHPQRVFRIDGDGWECDNEIAAFFCADENRFLEVSKKLSLPAILA